MSELNLRFLPNATDELIGGNPLVPLLHKWHKLEPKRIRKYNYLWVFNLGNEHMCDVFHTPESIQDKSVIEYCVKFSACSLNLSCELETTLAGTWHASFFLPRANYCLPLGNAEHPESAVAMLAAYVGALEVINAELVA